MSAMVIVVIVFSLSAMVISNVASTGISKEKQAAYILVKTLRNKTLKEERWIDEFIEENGLSIEKTIEDYNRTEGLKILKIKAFKGKEKLFESKEIILLKDE